MASGWAGDPVYGQPYSGTIDAPADTLPRTQTVLNTNKQRRETITITAADNGHITSGPSTTDYYHE